MLQHGDEDKTVTLPMSVSRDKLALWCKRLYSCQEDERTLINCTCSLNMKILLQTTDCLQLSFIFITLNKSITVDIPCTCIMIHDMISRQAENHLIFHILQSGFIKIGPHIVHIVVHQFIINQSFLREDKGSEVLVVLYYHITRILWGIHWHFHSGGILEYILEV